MIKRSFIGLTQTKLMCDLVEPGPKEPEAIPIPPRLILQLDEPLDSTKITLIKTGDMVKKGERLCLYKDSTEYISIPTSGTITSIISFAGEFGNLVTRFTLETDQKEEADDGFAQVSKTPDLESADKFLRYLPGAPPLKILSNPVGKIKKIVISGTDDDLMSTTRQYILSRSKDEIKDAVELLEKMTGINEICIAIPESMSRLSAFTGIKTLEIPEEYTSNQPRIILKERLGITLGAGESLDETGICFISIEALLSLANAYKAQAPAYDKIVTVIGKNGQKARVSAVIGTPLQTIFDQLGFKTENRDRIVIGGPLKGVAVYSLDHPVKPDTDTIIIQDKDDIPHVSDYPCINCGKCIRICPANVPVNLLVRYLEANLYQEAEDSFDLNSCIECGLCSYVCSAKIPIFQYIRLAKHELLRLESEMEADNA